MIAAPWRLRSTPDSVSSKMSIAGVEHAGEEIGW
jgi:hypothetical protein